MTLHEAVLDLHNELIGCEGYQFCAEGKDEIVVYHHPNISQEVYMRIPLNYKGWIVITKPMGDIVAGPAY